MEKGREDCRGLSEVCLAALALEGHPAAWDEIARRHSHRVLLALLARGVPLETAQDLVQEVWLRLMRQQRAGRLESITLPGLAVAQAGWLAREERRTNSRREAILSRTNDTHDDVDDDPGANPEEQAIRRERLDRIRRVLDGCSRRAREIFLAVYGPEGRGHADIARDLGISVQRVRQTLCEVRARVRVALAESESED